MKKYIPNKYLLAFFSLILIFDVFILGNFGNKEGILKILIVSCAWIYFLLISLNIFNSQFLFLKLGTIFHKKSTIEASLNKNLKYGSVFLYIVISVVFLIYALPEIL